MGNDRPDGDFFVNNRVWPTSYPHMNETAYEQKEILEQDLQIVRATLATITGDIRRISKSAADDIQLAVLTLERAQRKYAQAAGLGLRSE